MTGIYKFTNKENGKVYIGQSVNVERRIQSHYWPSHAEQRTPFDKILQAHSNLFTYEIVEECSADLLDEREQYWIEYYNSYYDGYNCTLGGKGARGETHSKATLTNEEVLQIIKLLEEGELNNTEIANLFNSTRERIRAINENKCWCHLHNYKNNIRNESLATKGIKRNGCGPQTGNTILTESQVKEIIKLLEKGQLNSEQIAKQYNVQANLIKNINQCKTWTYLHNYKKNIRKENGHYYYRNAYNSDITVEQAFEVVYLLENTALTQKEIAQQLNIPTSTVTHINCCDTWTTIHNYKQNIRKESGMGNRSLARISETTILNIIFLLENTNLTHQKIANQCHVSKDTVAKINQCKSHTEYHNYKKNIRQENGYKAHPNSQISESIAKKIIKLLENTTLTHKAIAEQNNISVKVVNGINQCKAWTYLHNYHKNIRKEAKLAKK